MSASDTLTLQFSMQNSLSLKMPKRGHDCTMVHVATRCAVQGNGLAERLVGSGSGLFDRVRHRVPRNAPRVAQLLSPRPE